MPATARAAATTRTRKRLRIEYSMIFSIMAPPVGHVSNVPASHRHAANVSSRDGHLACTRSPEGAAVNSPGRQPRDRRPEQHRPSPEGATVRKPGFCRPFRALREFDAADPGLTPRAIDG